MGRPMSRASSASFTPGVPVTAAALQHSSQHHTEKTDQPTGQPMSRASSASFTPGEPITAAAAAGGGALLAIPQGFSTAANKPLSGHGVYSRVL
jgi:hypothetical protein